MDTNPLRETTLRRAWNDFRRSHDSFGYDYVVEGVAVAATTALATIFIAVRNDWSDEGQVWTGLIAFIASLVGFAILSYLWHLVRTPIRQRNEARQMLREDEAERVRPKLFAVSPPASYLGLPLNRLDDGSYQAAQSSMGFQMPAIINRTDRTEVTRLTATLVIRFSRADGQGWETTNAIQVTPGQNPLAGPHARDFTWDASDPQQWVLGGLPLVMARDEPLRLPMMMLAVTDGDEAGAHFEKGETCALIIKMAVRTDKGSESLPDQIVDIGRSDIRDSEWFRESIQRESSGQPDGSSPLTEGDEAEPTSEPHPDR